MRTLSLGAGLAAALLAGGAAAQTTHDVNVSGFSFSPANLVIDVGDTVKWTNSGGIHNVESGVGGTPDGIFTSGAPSSAAWTFSVTFDAAFLAANPKPGNAYDYYCSTHVAFGMDGTVTVKVPPVITPYGCGVNPAGSLVSLAGAPTVGSTWTVGVDNPTGGQPAGSLAFLFAAVFAAPGFPCGTVLPGFGMASPASPGELLILLTPPPVVSLGPTPWAGAGTPTPFGVPVPPTPSLVGANVFFQGAILDPVLFHIGLSEGLDVTLGS